MIDESVRETRHDFDTHRPRNRRVAPPEPVQTHHHGAPSTHGPSRTTSPLQKLLVQDSPCRRRPPRESFGERVQELLLASFETRET